MSDVNAPVSSIQHRKDDTTNAGTPTTGERAVPYHCPYCADEDLRPLGATPGAWHCRSCSRAFWVRFLGMQAPTDPRPADPPSVTPPIPSGGPR